MYFFTPNFLIIFITDFRNFMQVLLASLHNINRMHLVTVASRLSINSPWSNFTILPTDNYIFLNF